MVIRDRDGDVVKGEPDQHAQHVDVEVKPGSECLKDQEAAGSEPGSGERDVVGRLHREREAAAAVSPKKGSAQSAVQGQALQSEVSSDDTCQADAAAPVGAAVQQTGNAGTAFRRPAPIITNITTSLVGSSPTQQRPRGWQAILPSPTQADEQVAAIVAAGCSRGQSLSQEPLPVLSPAADDETDKVFSSEHDSTASPAPATTSAQAVLLQGSNTSATVARLSNLNIMSPAGSLSSASGLSRPQSMVRPDLRIQPPPSPCEAGCVTPTGLLSPNAMARPYSGPRITEGELDYDLIDGISAGDSSNTASSSSSPIPVGSAVYTRSGGLRSSRDHDLRRMAMTNQLLNSPRLPLVAATTSGPAPMFTGDTRARALGSAGGTGGVSSPAPSENARQAAGVAVAGEGDSTPSSTPGSYAAQLQQRLQNVRRQGYSPASVLSPPGTISSSAPPSSTRSLPTTPAGSQHRLVTSTAAPSSSRSSPMTASPVPPPTMGPAAALLAGAVEASPSTPRSPLSVMYSPHSGRTVHSVGGVPLPAPLFAGVCAFGQSTPSAPAACPSFGAIGSAALPPSGRTSLSNISGSLFSPPHTSRLSREPSGPNSAQATAEPAEAAQPMEEDSESQLPQPADPQPTGFVATAGAPLALSIGNQPANLMLQQQGVQQHLPHVLRQRLQVADTRYGPHGESPLSPSHHAQLQHLHNLHQGDSLLSPSCPTPLVQPAVAAAATGQPDVAAAAAATPAAAHLVGDVGRRDVHEWLDQHSWTLQYELPRSLRDVADFARSQRLSATAIGMHTEDRGTVPQEQELLQQGEPESAAPANVVGGLSHSAMMPARVQSDGMTPELHNGMPESQLAAVGSAHRADHSGFQQLGLVGHDGVATDGHAAASASTTVASRISTGYDWFLGSFGLSIGQAGPVVSDGLGDSDMPQGSLLPNQRSSSEHSYQGLHDTSRQSRSSNSECCPGEISHTGIHVVADSSSAGGLQSAVAAAGPSVHAVTGEQVVAADGSDAGTAAHLFETPGDITFGEPGQTAVRTRDNRAHVVSTSTMRSSNAASSSTRLLSPGSHRYMPGSPVADNACCNTCQPDDGSSALAASGGALLHHPTAELLCSSMAGQAAGPGEAQEMVVSPSSYISNSSSQCQHVTVTSSIAVDAAVETPPQQPGPHSMTAEFPTAMQQRMQHSRLSESGVRQAAGHIQPVIKNAPPAPSYGHGSYVHASSSASKLVQREGSHTGELHSMEASGPASLVNQQLFLLSLLRNKDYMHWLLSALPGVVPESLEVQQAISNLQVTLEQQCVNSQQQGSTGIK